MVTQRQNTPDSALTDLSDHMVKLVAYTIVTLLRDHEDIMPDGEGSLLLTDSLTAEAFTAFIIAKYLQEALKKGTLSKECLDKHRKYLRVYYVVSTRWPREPGKFEERQIDALHTIREAITH